MIFLNKNIRFLLFFSLFSLNCFAQKNKNNFSLEGLVSVDSGKVIFELVADSSFYPTHLRHLEANIVDGKFNLKGELQNPVAYQISINNRSFISDLFVLDKGKQIMILNLKSNKLEVSLNNPIMKLDYPPYINAFSNVNYKRKELDNDWDSLILAYNKQIPPNIQRTLDLRLKKSYLESDSTLLSFVSEHPNSYYSFWRFINLTPFGYYKIFDNINSKLSDSLKNSYSGKFLQQYLKNSNLYALSKAIHKFPIVGINNNKIDSIDYRANKYTLLDFWYSNCGPCIAQFAEMNLIYTQFHLKGFEIIGISTDYQKNKNNWLNTIKAHNLQWPQYIDEGGLQSAKLSIKAFPSNILVDKNGKVVAINLLPSEINTYLKTAL
nr:TlpA family protein disulfide reductase [Pseudopedobacter sp.]